MKKIILITFLFFSSLYSSGTYDGVYFTDYEETATLYFCNYYPYQAIRDLDFTTGDTDIIVANRSTPYTSVSQIANLSGINSFNMERLRSQSHIVDWNIYTDDFGMTLHQTNFLYGLTGLLLGFTFLFGFVQIIISEEYK